MQSLIVICTVSWPLYRDTYRIVTLLVIHSTSAGGHMSQWSNALLGLSAECKQAGHLLCVIILGLCIAS